MSRDEVEQVIGELTRHCDQLEADNRELHRQNENLVDRLMAIEAKTCLDREIQEELIDKCLDMMTKMFPDYMKDRGPASCA